jgi:hypothetical protein
VKRSSSADYNLGKNYSDENKNYGNPYGTVCRVHVAIQSVVMEPTKPSLAIGYAAGKVELEVTSKRIKSYISCKRKNRHL